MWNWERRRDSCRMVTAQPKPRPGQDHRRWQAPARACEGLLDKPGGRTTLPQNERACDGSLSISFLLEGGRTKGPRYTENVGEPPASPRAGRLKGGNPGRR